MTVALLALALGAAACSADNGYVENADDSMFLRLPNDWVTYDEDEIYAEPLSTAFDAMSTLDIIREVNTNWVVGFGAEDLERPSAALSMAAGAPVGFMAVVQLIGPVREGFNVVDQRSFGWPPLTTGQLLDPVAAYRDNPRGPVEVFAYEEFEVPGRGSGTRVRAGFDDAADSVIRDITVVVDPLTTELYILSIGCYAQCFLANADAIDDIVESFTLEEIR